MIDFTSPWPPGRTLSRSLGGTTGLAPLLSLIGAWQHVKAPGDQTAHFVELDGMRGALACLVMLMHFGMDRITTVVTRGAITVGEWDLSVDFFFMLSGFVLARSFLNKQPDLNDYLIQRVCRLAPMFLLALAIVVFMGARFDGWTLGANILIIQSVVGLRSLNFPSWSIPFELFFPVLGLIAIRRWPNPGRAVLGLIFGTLMIGAMIAAYGLAIGVDYRSARAFCGLGLGMVMYLLWGDRVSLLRGSPLVVSALFAASLCVMLVAHRYPWSAGLFPPLVVAVILTAATAKSLFSARPLQALGRWSYSIYLLHIPVRAITGKIVDPAMLNHNPPLKILMAVFTIALAAVCYRYVELPSMNFARRRIHLAKLRGLPA